MTTHRAAVPFITCGNRLAELTFTNPLEVKDLIGRSLKIDLLCTKQSGY